MGRRKEGSEEGEESGEKKGERKGECERGKPLTCATHKRRVR